MKKRLRRLIVFVGVLGLVKAVNVGTAFADHDANSPAFGETVGEAPSPGPVGQHIVPGSAPGHPGADNGFDRLHDGDGNEIPGGPGTNTSNPAVIALANNPNCPLHWQ